MPESSHGGGNMARTLILGNKKQGVGTPPLFKNWQACCLGLGSNVNWLTWVGLFLPLIVTVFWPSVMGSCLPIL